MTWFRVELSWKWYVVILSQIGITHGAQFKGFMAKKNYAGEIGSPYKIIPKTRSTLEGFTNCLKDTGVCSSFSFDQNNERTLLYSSSAQIQGDFVIYPADRCPNDRGCIYSKQFDYVLYVNEQEKMLWRDARDECRLGCGELVSLDTDEKFANVQKMLEGRPHTYWLGGRIVSGTYLWLNGKVINSTYWHPNQPNNAGPCVSTGREWFGSFGMDDEPVNNRHYFICEY